MAVHTYLTIPAGHLLRACLACAALLYVVSVAANVLTTRGVHGLSGEYRPGVSTSDRATLMAGRRLLGSQIVLTSNTLHTIRRMDASRVAIVPARLARLRASLEELRMGNSVVGNTQASNANSSTAQLSTAHSSQEDAEEEAPGDDAWKYSGLTESTQGSREPHFIKRSEDELPVDLNSKPEALMLR